MKHAYLIIAHNEFELLKNLISVLDDNRNDIYIHYDAKLKKLPELSVNKSELYILKKRINVCWADFSVVEAELALLRTAFSNNHYAYYHLLSGVDLPLKSQDYIHAFFDKNTGKEFVDFCLYDVSNEMERKMMRWHLFSKDLKNVGEFAFITRLMRATFIRIQEYLGIKRNKQINFRKGSQWFSITSDFVEYLLSQENIFRNIYSHTFCPDEVIIQTACWNSKFRHKLYDYSASYRGYMRLIDWTRGAPYVWRDSDYDELINSKCLFARKFSSENIGVVKKITEFVKKNIQ